MQPVESYDSSKPLSDKILYVLSVMEKASANEVAMEIMELDGISTEEGVAEITVEVENELEKLQHDDVVHKLKEHKQKTRYVSKQKSNNYSLLKPSIMSHEQNRALLDALTNCAEECNHCAAACLDEQDVKMLARCIKLDIDCAEICSLAASFVARGSEHAQHLLDECADVCEACAEECEKHAGMGMEHCKRCAEACRKCAEACHSGVAA